MQTNSDTVMTEFFLATLLIMTIRLNLVISNDIDIILYAPKQGKTHIVVESTMSFNSMKEEVDMRCWKRISSQSIMHLKEDALLQQ